MIEVKVYTDEGEEVTLRLPSNKKVCGRCHGEGTHDCWEGGMTGDEMAEQGPEFFEDYMSGVYSRKCTECNGLRVVDVVDRSRAKKSDLKLYDDAQEEQRNYEAARQSEIRMGC